MAERGLRLSDDAVRYGCRTCGHQDTPQRRRRRPRPSETGPLGARLLTSNGSPHSWWRAVDQEGMVLDMFVQRRRDRHAAQQVFRQWLTGLTDVPRVIVTNQRKRDREAQRALRPRVEPRPHRAVNHRAEHSHPPTRPRERRMGRCTSPGHAPRVLAADGRIAAHVRPRRPHRPAGNYHQARPQRCQTGREISGIAQAA